MEETKTILLTKPIKLGEAPEILEVTLTEPTAGQIETALKEPSTTTSNIVLIALIAKLAPAQVRAMGLRDFNKCVEYLQSFTNGEASEASPG